MISSIRNIGSKRCHVQFNFVGRCFQGKKHGSLILSPEIQNPHKAHKTARESGYSVNCLCNSKLELPRNLLGTQTPERARDDTGAGHPIHHLDTPACGRFYLAFLRPHRPQQTYLLPHSQAIPAACHGRHLSINAKMNQLCSPLNADPRGGACCCTARSSLLPDMAIAASAFLLLERVHLKGCWSGWQG